MLAGVIVDAKRSSARVRLASLTLFKSFSFYIHRGPVYLENLQGLNLSTLYVRQSTVHLRLLKPFRASLTGPNSALDNGSERVISP